MVEFKNWHFIEVGKRGEMTRMGVVIDQASEGIYLCQVFANEFSRAEMVEAKEMLTWNLFPDQIERDRFINAQKAANEERQQRARAEIEAAAAGVTTDAPPGTDLGLEIEHVPGAEVPEGKPDGNPAPKVIKPGKSSTDDEKEDKDAPDLH